MKYNYNFSFNYIIIYLTPKIIIFIILLSPINSFAVDYKAQAQELANSINIQGNFTQSNVDNIPGYEGTDIEQTNYYNDPASLEDDSVNKLQNDEAGQLVNDNFNNQGDWQFDFKNDPLFASEHQSNNSIDWLSGGYSECNPDSENEDITINDTKTCDQYISGSDNICQIPRVVEVESNYEYFCTKELGYTSKNCTQNLNVEVVKEELSEQHFGNPITGFGGSGSSPVISLYLSGHVTVPLSSGGVIYVSGTGRSANCSYNYGTLSGFITNIKGISYAHTDIFGAPVTIVDIHIGKNIYWCGDFTIKKQISEPSSVPLSITSNWEEICN